MPKVIDSHVHLFSQSYAKDGRLPLVSESSKLAQNDFRLDEYKKVIAEAPNHEVEGLIFLEVCVNSDLSYEGWKLPIEEYLYVERIILNNQKHGEGSASGADFLKGIIPWAPIPQGAKKLEEYVNQMKSQSVDPKSFERVKGFRYLFDGLEPGAILQQGYIDSINWLGEHGFVYDLGLNIRQDGNRQLKEVVELLKKTENVTYILNHLSKPNLVLSSKEVENDESFIEWKNLIAEISQNTGTNKIYIKFSGGIAELPETIAQDEDSTEAIARIKPWLGTFVDNFPSNQIIFGSDWPIAAKKLKIEDTWAKWVKITDVLVEKFGLNADDFYKNNVIEAYGLV